MKRKHSNKKQKANLKHSKLNQARHEEDDQIMDHIFGKTDQQPKNKDFGQLGNMDLEED